MPKYKRTGSRDAKNVKREPLRAIMGVYLLDALMNQVGHSALCSFVLPADVLYLFSSFFLIFFFASAVSEGGGERAGRFSSWSADLLATLGRVIPVIAAKAARKNK